MNEIQGGRWDRFLRRLFSMKGERAIAPTLSPEIVPYLAVEPPDDPKNFWLRSERLMSAMVGQGPVAGQLGQAELRNPVGSGTITTVVECHGFADAISTMVVSVGPLTAFGAAGTKGIRDLRWDDGTGGPIVRSTAAFILFTNAARQGTQIYEHRVGAFEDAFFRHAIVLPPGFSAFISFAPANTATDLGFVWVERPVEPSEL